MKQVPKLLPGPSFTLDRRAYLLWGVALFALKYNLDRLVSAFWFNRPLSLFDAETMRLYLWHNVPAAGGQDYFVLLLAMSLPFLLAGVWLTLGRLRSLGWNPWWLLMFFVPVLKLVFFTLLCVVPAGGGEPVTGPRPAVAGLLDRFIPRSVLGGVLAGLAWPVLLALGGAWLGITYLGAYGWALFVGLPFCVGLMGATIHGWHERRSLMACLMVAGGAVAMAGLGLLLLAMEGIICLVMALPIAVAIGGVGGLAGYVIQAAWPRRQATGQVFCAGLLLAPALMLLEHALPPALPLLEVRSNVIINAPARVVWQNVVTFAELPPPREWIFRLGVAYPLRAEIRGHGVGAVRHCVFSTGPFVEPIEVWDEPRLLKFSVTQNPEPMQEWTPYREVHPRHLEGYLESKSGQFRLTELDANRTLLEGTTWYHHHLWPASYWQLWSDHIIHIIHLRVLNHVKSLSEGAARPTR